MNEQVMSTFSGLDRRENLQQLGQETFDILVIGGGATGCGIALDAASRGMKTALVEKLDFAGGTSSKSTKLIHGGLRYLKQLEVALVRETGTERAMVHRLAPHLVLPEKMLLPITDGGTYGKLAASFGVMVYDFLAGVESEDRRKMLSKEETLKIEPLLDESNLKGSCYYAEYRTDDARLTIELVKRANSYGALAINYCTADDFIYEKDKIHAVECTDELTGNKVIIKAKQVVSAGGPWVDKLRKINKSINNKQLHLTKGVHLVFPHAKLPLQNSVYFDVPDGRMLFAIPRGKITYVGTTDTNYNGDLNRVVATKEDADYLLNAINQTFPSIHLKQEDIESNWAGLRPLIHEDGKSPSELSRKDEIFESSTGLISIAGGKLTGYRKMAERVVDLVDKRLPENFTSCQTNNIPLVEDSLLDKNAVQTYIKETTTTIASKGLEAYHAEYLVTNYGTQSKMIISKMDEYPDEPVTALIRAELWFGVHHEMVNSLTDFYVRRTGRLYFDIKSIEKTRGIITEDLTQYLNWSSSRTQKEVEELNFLLKDATHYYQEEFEAV